MISLRTAGSRFKSKMVTENGVPFLGTVEQLGEGRVPSYDFSEPRLLLRVNPVHPLNAGIIITDPAHRRWLLAENDTVFSSDKLQWVTFRMLLINSYPHWQREGSVVDTLTGQERGSTMDDRGHIWALTERTEREFQDNTLRAKEQSKRIFTAATLELDDWLDKMRVKRVDRIWGITLAEVQ